VLSSYVLVRLLVSFPLQISRCPLSLPSLRARLWIPRIARVFRSLDSFSCFASEQQSIYARLPLAQSTLATFDDDHAAKEKSRGVKAEMASGLDEPDKRFLLSLLFLFLLLRSVFSLLLFASWTRSRSLLEDCRESFLPSQFDLTCRPFGIE